MPHAAKQPGWSAPPGSGRSGAPVQPGLMDAFGAPAPSSETAAAAARQRSGPATDVPVSFLRLADILVLLGALWVAAEMALVLQRYLAPGTPLGSLLEELWVPSSAGSSDLQPYARPLVVLLVVIPVVTIAMTALGGYRSLHRQSRARVVFSSVLSAFAGMSALTLVLFTFRVQHFSRSFVLLYGTTAAVGFVSYRCALRLYKLRRAEAGWYARNVAIVGDLGAVGWMQRFFDEHANAAAQRVVGYFDVGIEEAGTTVPVPGLERLGRVDDVGEVMIHRPIHEVVAVLGPSAPRWIGAVTEACDYFGVTLRMVPHALLSGAARDLRRLHYAGDQRLPEIVLTPPHLDSDQLFFKRLIDILISASLLILLAPLFAIIAAAIRITTPELPVFYRWRVIGYKGQPFTGYKFTTMIANAEARLHDLLDRNEMTGPVFKIRDDPRVTRFGRFLRKYSLNELPQLWSVLVGDMSLVGPRPAFPHELERYELWHKRKLSVKPGITCLWQVSGRNRVSDFDDWVRLDLEYIDRWSLWLDFKILVRTAWAVVAGTGS